MLLNSLMLLTAKSTIKLSHKQQQENFKLFKTILFTITEKLFTVRPFLGELLWQHLMFNATC